ncbi:efflux RND transporter periplasmic adaptor subunit [soil metagenome]
MRFEQSRAKSSRISWRRGCWMAAFLLAASGGCRQPSSSSPATPAQAPTRSVTVVKPERKTIRREIAQPGLIQAFERTPIVSRIPGYVLKWNVDIGDPIHKDDVLAELWVPEMVSELQLKAELVQQARKALAMTKAQVATAKAQVQEAEAGLSRAEANNNYWKNQSARFTSLVKDSVLDKQTQEDTLNQFRSAGAALAESRAKIDSAKAMQQEKERAQDKAEVDILAADADRRRQADLVSYAKLTAPYEGIVTQRNINTKQFVQPATTTAGDVLYVVERTDTVRVFVQVPETDSDWVHNGTPATIRVQALQGEEFKGKVTRTAWSLNQVSRTLQTEIDLPNPDLPKTGRRLRPGMYVYATIGAEWPNLLTVPASAVVTEGDVNIGYKTFCYLVENGHVKRTQIETGARNAQLVEVARKRAPGSKPGNPTQWEGFAGSEEIVQGDLSGLQDGQSVEVKSSGK